MGFKPGLDDQLVSFGALTLLVLWPLKIVPKITYDVYGVLSGTLSLYTTLLSETTVCLKKTPRTFLAVT